MIEVTAKTAALAWPGTRSAVLFLRWNGQIPVRSPTIEKIMDLHLILRWVDDALIWVRWCGLTHPRPYGTASIGIGPL